MSDAAAAATLRDYVVTPELHDNFDEAFGAEERGDYVLGRGAVPGTGSARKARSAEGLKTRR